jgi:hypothetical protein
MNPGPGEYNPIDFMNKKNNKDGDFFFKKDVPRFKNKNKNEILPGPGRYFNPESSDFFVMEKGKLKENFFFKPNTLIDKDPEVKYFKDKGHEKFSVPGVGRYNLRGKIGKSFENNMPYQIMKINEYEPPKVENDFPSLRTDFYELKSSFDGKKSVTSVFTSKSPKIKKVEKNAMPGPSYYKPQVLPKRLNFNFNSEDQWI